MDFNAAPSGNARGTEVIIPDNASPEVRAAAQRYNAGVASFASQYGIQDYPVRGVKTRSENGRGVSNTIHTEPFFNNDLAMQQAILENPQAFAEVYRDAFGTLPDMRLIAAHGIGADRGAASSVFKDETSFGELMAKTLLGSSQPVADDAMEALGRSPIRRDIAPFIGQQPISAASTPTGGILSNEGNQMAQQPQGLLGSMGIQRRDPNAQGETSQPFYNRKSFGDTMARIAPALGRMGVMGLEGPAQAALDNRNKRQGDERLLALGAQQRNATAEWLRSQGADKLADGVLSGAITGAQALSNMQASAGGSDTVQSSVPLDDGTTVIIMRNGSRRVLAPNGEELTGQAAADAILKAREFTVANQTAISQGRRTGTLEADLNLGGQVTAASDISAASVKFGINAYDSYGKLQTSLGNIDEAISAIDGGAQSGLVYNMLPNITLASASLVNSMNRMGLDVVGSVTFGALSEGEMRLAMSTAVPQDLAPTELRAWLVRRRDAQAKAAATMQNAAQFLTSPGPNQTINDWIKRNKAENKGNVSPKTGGGADLSGMSDAELQAIAEGR
tara:strand:+ start:5090 stop:6778 length:1689 start_codon:yes stop_codon:yes gene_type:complete